MKITIPSQEITIPDPFDPKDIHAAIADINSRLIKLESQLPAPTLAPMPKTLFDPLSWVYKKTSTMTKLANSATLVADLNAQNRINGPWCNVGTPIYFVTNADPMTIVTLTDSANLAGPNGQELLKGINLPVGFQGSTMDTDRNAEVYNLSTDTLYDFWQVTNTNGKITAVSAGILHNASKSDGTFARMSYWNSARASHITIGATHNLVSELKAGVFPHVGGISIGVPKNTFVAPAKSSDGDASRVIPEGTRFRFPADIPIPSTLTPLAKMLITQGRDYGFVLVDRTNSSLVHYFEAADLTPYLNGKQLWEVMGTKTMDTEIPYSKLEAFS